jgi:hypothetical protein
MTGEPVPACNRRHATGSGPKTSVLGMSELGQTEKDLI